MIKKAMKTTNNIIKNKILAIGIILGTVLYQISASSKCVDNKDPRISSYCFVWSDGDLGKSICDHKGIFTSPELLTNSSADSICEYRYGSSQ